MISPEKKIESDRELRREPHTPKPVRKCHICGATVTYCNFNRHAKTKKHRDAEYVNFERFEMENNSQSI